MALASARTHSPHVLSDEDSKWSLFLAFAKDLIEESREAASSQWESPEPWRDDRATDSQVKLIRSRRCGPDFRLRLPEPLYKAVLYIITRNTSSRNVRSKGQATDILNAFAYADEDVLSMWYGYTRKVLNGELNVRNETTEQRESERERRRRVAQAFYADLGDGWELAPS